MIINGNLRLSIEEDDTITIHFSNNSEITVRCYGDGVRIETYTGLGDRNRTEAKVNEITGSAIVTIANLTETNSLI